jgi:hypothetical protein
MIKEIFVKYFTKILVLITVAGVAMFGYSLWRDANEKRKYAHLIGTKEKYEQLTKYTAKLETQYKEQQDLAKAAEKRFSEVVRKKNERIKLLSDATYLIGKHVEKQHGPDYYFETPKRTRNYVLNEIRFAGPDSPPLGYILIKNDGRTYKRNYKYEIRVEGLTTVDEKTGRVKVYSKAYLVQTEPSPLKKRIEGYRDWTNTPYQLPIVGGVTLVDPTQPDVKNRFLWWSPRLNGGTNVGVGSDGMYLRPGLDVSLSGYGKSRNDMEWKLFHIGINSDTELEKPGLHFMPASYRFWSSLLTNTYIGAGIGLTEDGTDYFLNMNVSF